MAVIEGVCTMCAAVGVIAWNALISENRRRHRRLQRSKSERARGRGERQIALEEVTTGVEGGESCNPRLEAGESRNPRLEPPISPQSHDLSQQRHHHQQQHQRGSSSMSPEATNFTPGADTEEAAPSAITVTVTTATAAATSPTSNSERDSYRRNNEGHEGDDDNDGVRSDSNEMFRELVMIMDATPLPSPRRKLAEVPEDVDPCSSISGAAMRSPTSPGGTAAAAVLGDWGCDLSQDFYLCKPFSPPPRGGRGGSNVHRRSVRQGNRPRTFSEYTPGPESSYGSNSTSAGGRVGDNSTLGMRCRRESSPRTRMTRSNSEAPMVDGVSGADGGQGGTTEAVGNTRGRFGGAHRNSFSEDNDADGRSEYGRLRRDRYRVGIVGCDDDADVEELARRAFEMTTNDDVWMVWPTGKLELAQHLTDGTETSSPPFSNSSKPNPGKSGRNGGAVSGCPRPLYPHAREVLPVS